MCDPARGVSISLLFLVFGLGLQAQRSARVVGSPVPFWPPEGIEAGRSGNQRVFFDSAENQVVFLLPDPSGLQAPRQIRYDIPNGATPSISFSVQAIADGKARYTYILGDDPRSRQRSQRLTILLPSHDNGLVSAPGNWKFGTENTTLPDRTATVAMATMRKISWTAPGPNPAAALALGLESSYLPGFAEAFVEGQVPNPLTQEVLGALPAEVASQATPFLEPGFGTSKYVVLAPLFRPNASKLVIAANYHYGVSVLTQSVLTEEGRLDPKSAYMKDLLAVLGSFLRSGGVGELLPKAAPSSALEAEIQKALTLASQGSQN